MEGESLITIVAIFLAAILIGIFPMMALAERNDDISELSVQTAVAEFVNTARKTGKITADDYDKLVTALSATGNTYDISLEVKKIDENPSKKTTQMDETKIGENIYYSVYTTQILEALEQKGNKYVLKEGDIITATASNTNTTISQMLKNFFYSLAGQNAYRIVGSQSGVVSVTGS